MKKNKIIAGIIIVIALVVAGVGSYFIYKNMNKPAEEQENIEKRVGTTIYLYSLEGSSFIYMTYNKEDIYAEAKEEELDLKKTLLGEFICTTDCSIKTNDNDYVLIHDEAYYVFDIEKNDSIKISLNINDSIDLQFKEYGLIVYDPIKGKYGYFDITSNKMIAETEYTQVIPGPSIKKGYLLVNIRNDDNTYKYYKINTETLEKELVYVSEISWLGQDVVNDTIFYFSSPVLSISKYLDENFNELFNGTSYSEYHVNNDNLYLRTEDKTKVIKYDDNFNKISESKEYKQVGSFISNYMVVQDETNLVKILDLDENEIAQLGVIDYPKLDYFKLSKEGSNYYFVLNHNDGCIKYVINPNTNKVTSENGDLYCQFS